MVGRCLLYEISYNELNFIVIVAYFRKKVKFYGKEMNYNETD